MSQLFSTLGVAKSGLHAYKTWIDAVSDNVANMNNVTRTDEPAFQERFLSVESIDDSQGVGAGVVVTDAWFGDPNGIVSYEPTHPFADENGMVRRPNIELSEQMVFLQLAQRGYQANIDVHERAKEAYQSAISIGQ